MFLSAAEVMRRPEGWTKPEVSLKVKVLAAESCHVLCSDMGGRLGQNFPGGGTDEGKKIIHYFLSLI